MFCNSLTTANKIKTSVLLFVPAKQVVDRKEYSSRVSKQNQKRDLLLSISMLAVTVSLFYFMNYNEVFATPIQNLGPNATTTNTSNSERSQELFDKVKNSVVRIDTLVQYVNPRVTVNDEPFLQEPSGSIGSGFVYDESGKIVTNYHVV
ncbi:MAG: S1C family serine protease, partial [Nitrososphaeraceae archaeon]